MTANKQFKEVKVNFNGVFATINSAEELKYVAQSIVNQTNEAYKFRLAELTASTTSEKATEVSIEAAPKETAVEPKKATTTKVKTTKVEKSSKAEKKSGKSEVKQVLISNLTKDDIKKMGVKFVQYSEKCVALSGETKAIKEQIKEIAGGHWNHARQCWFLKSDDGHKLAKLMGQKVLKKAE